MKVGIVGSRRRNTLHDRKLVFRLVERLIKENPGEEIILVSGSCPKGADHFAAEAAKVFGLTIVEHPVPKKEYAHKGEWVAEAFARNRLIALDSDVIYALRASDHTGGTENTIKHAEELQKRTFEVDEKGECLLIVDAKDTAPCDAVSQPD